MTRVAGIDGAPGNNWAVVMLDSGRFSIRKIADTELFNFVVSGNFKIVGIDVPIGLLDFYERGGRACDREARKLLGPRRNSVFPAPIRPVLGAKSYAEASDLTRASAPCGKGMTKQAYNILPKIKQIGDLLRERPELRDVVREVHPEVCFRELAGGKPLTHHKSKQWGRDERMNALARHLFDLKLTEKTGREYGLGVEDVVDAAVGCWSALRLAACHTRFQETLLVSEWRSGFE